MMIPSGSGRDRTKPGLSHCASINIDLREKQVRCNRELGRINKSLAGMERQHLKNMRKFDSAQRGLMLLIGESPYPDCLNVVSDTPTLAEILSSPEIVQILCELRNTGALMTDENLFQAFSDQLAKSHKKFPFFKEFQGPLDYLKQYRRNLIQEFFDTLKTEAEMKLFVVPVDPTSNLMNQLPLSGQSNRSSAEKSGSANKENEQDAGSTGYDTNTSRTSSSNKDSESPAPDTSLRNRIVKSSNNKTEKNKVGFGGMPAPPTLPHQGKPASSSGAGGGDSESMKSSGDTNKRDDESDIDRDSLQMSKQEIFAPTDYIPTGQGYMTVEDWNFAVLEQLKKAQDDERKKEERKKSPRRERAPSTGDDTASTNSKQRDHSQSRRHHHQHTDYGFESEGSKTEDGSGSKDGSDGTNENNNSGSGEDAENGNANNSNNNLNEEEREAEEIRKKMAAAAAAEEEAKYRLDQKIMGLAGITSLYKSNNIGFAKYFENRNELAEKEINRMKEKRKVSRARRKSFRRMGETEKEWMESNGLDFDDESGGATPGNSNFERRKKSLLKEVSSSDTVESSSNASGYSASAASSRRRILKAKNKMKKNLSSKRTKSYQREEFDTFVRGLISNIEEMSAINVQVSGLAKKRPAQLQRLIDPLVRLLKRDDLFETLNDEDMFFSEFEGGKKELERIVASHLPPSNKIKPGGFTFKLPSRTNLRAGQAGTPPGSSGGRYSNSDKSGISDDNCYPARYIRTASTPPTPPFSARSNKPSTAGSSGPSIGYYFTNSKWDNVKKAKSLAQSDTCWICPPKSLQRVCCAACRAKTQQACNDVLRRDRNCKLTLNLNSWRIPGMHPPPYKRLHEKESANLLFNPYTKATRIPADLRKFYESAYPLTLDERSRSVFLEPPANILDSPPPVKQAAPTPVYLKKKLYPLPAVLNTVPAAMAAAVSAKSNKSATVPDHEHPAKKSGSVLYRKRASEKESVFSVLPVTQSFASSATAGTIGRRRRGMKEGTSIGALSRLSHGTIRSLPLTDKMDKSSKRIGDARFITTEGANLVGSGTVGSATVSNVDSSMESWTLKISKFDILRLRHELDGESVKEKMAKFEAQYLRPNST